MRPNITYVIGVLGRYQSNLGVNHWKATKKVMRYFQGVKDYTLMYRRVDYLEVTCYSYADFASCMDLRKSTSGYIFMLASGVVS